MEIIFSIEEIQQAARTVLENNPKKVILFNGTMGAGKTTFVKALAKHLGVKDATSSPTFSLVNEYLADNGNYVYHFDFYRIKNESEAYDMGVDEYLYSGNWCLIEWPENISGLIPQEHSSITIKQLSNGKRQLSLQV